MTETETPKRKAYRFLTGPDDAAFCQRISDALAEGYVLYGAPIMQIDSQGKRHCGQAVVLPEYLSGGEKG
ncbi:MAG: DUF1737 domain-containing protein [Rhodobiaceae bacterium]|jgi:hypothetical protein